MTQSCKLPKMHRKSNCTPKTEKLQQQDTNIETLKCKLQNNRLDKEYYSLDKNELLMKKVTDGGHKFCAIYLPSILIFQVL